MGDDTEIKLFRVIFRMIRVLIMGLACRDLIQARPVELPLSRWSRRAAS